MNWRRTLFCCLLVAALLALWSAAGVAGGLQVAATDTDAGRQVPDAKESSASLTQGSTESAAGLAQDDIDADSVLMRADVRESGDADWVLQYRLRLDSDERRAAFEEIEAEIDDNQSVYLDPFEQRLTETVRAAENSTGREMSADDFAVSTRTETQPQAEFGIVTFSFEWSGFATVDGDEIRAGDAVDQLFLEQDQRLEINWPEGYRLDSRTPEPSVSDSQRVVWRGPIDFDTGQPRVVLVPADEGFPIVPAAGAGLIVLALAVAAYWRRREDRTGSGPSGAASTGPEAETAPDDGAGTSASSTPPPELLSNEERLLQLLRENGGRMKQKAAAEELDWSAAKTSQVVGDLRDADEIESFRLGRENILTLPDVDIVEEEYDRDDGE